MLRKILMVLGVIILSALGYFIIQQRHQQADNVQIQHGKSCASGGQYCKKGSTCDSHHNCVF